MNDIKILRTNFLHIVLFKLVDCRLLCYRCITVSLGVKKIIKKLNLIKKFLIIIKSLIKIKSEKGYYDNIIKSKRS